MTTSQATRLAEIRERARKRGPINLRCPHCRHYLVGILSPRGDYKSKTGERSKLYCSWPNCAREGYRVRLPAAVRGRGPRNGSRCYTSQEAKSQKLRAKSKH